mmetsp:Transcript_9857/g.24608  ORF Transcript_9857/g.24608 Transcript_9857/m.24608 type:complete len:389 (-) Transcript_9857:78-1244(-)
MLCQLIAGPHTLLIPPTGLAQRFLGGEREPEEREEEEEREDEERLRLLPLLLELELRPRLMGERPPLTGERRTGDLERERRTGLRRRGEGERLRGGDARRGGGLRRRGEGERRRGGLGRRPPYPPPPSRGGLLDRLRGGEGRLRGEGERLRGGGGEGSLRGGGLRLPLSPSLSLSLSMPPPLLRGGLTPRLGGLGRRGGGGSLAGGGGERLRGWMMKLTLTTLPSIWPSCMWSMAFCASSIDEYSTCANPRGRFTALSMASSTDTSLPKVPKISCKCSSVTLRVRLPTTRRVVASSLATRLSAILTSPFCLPPLAPSRVGGGDLDGPELVLPDDFDVDGEDDLLRLPEDPEEREGLLDPDDRDGLLEPRPIVYVHPISVRVAVVQQFR